ncbi:hypothetical protein LXA43DRAFT_524093 [Ganoderma leucocontextum]|nr:hypothetical protein LXA43DRAFT_524093 [Ganoderma leucocontextum]
MQGLPRPSHPWHAPLDSFMNQQRSVARNPCHGVSGSLLHLWHATAVLLTVQSDFARLEHYAPHIKYITQAEVGLIAPDVLEALAIHSPAGILLPNIHTLEYRCFSFTQSETSQVLFGPKLASVCHMYSCSLPRQGDTEYSDADNLDCIRALPRICPVLSRRHSQLRGSHQCRSHRYPIGLPAISHLGRLQNLKIFHTNPSYEITHWQTDFLTLTSTSTDGQAYFPSLRNMNFLSRIVSSRSAHGSSI